jgi:quercetin dioxygenase-like cupin family protein
MDHLLKDIQPIEIVAGYKAQFIHTATNTYSFVEVVAGAAMPQHEHMHEQVSQVLEGRFEFTIDGVTKVYEPGTVAVIPGHVRHGGVALTDCKLLDVFSPVREDYFQLTKQSMVDDR